MPIEKPTSRSTKYCAVCSSSPMKFWSASCKPINSWNEASSNFLKEYLMQNITHYIPILTTLFSIFFFITLFNHWQRKPNSTYLMWWTIGVFCYGIGTLTESINTLFGWSVVDMKLWYIAGALLGALPPAQGTVYLLFKKQVANVLSWIFIVYIAIATISVILSPVNMSLVDPTRLTGKVMMWEWVRLFPILPNTYALI